MSEKSENRVNWTPIIVTAVICYTFFRLVSEEVTEIRGEGPATQRIEATERGRLAEILGTRSSDRERERDEAERWSLLLSDLEQIRQDAAQTRALVEAFERVVEDVDPELWEEVRE